MTKYRVLLVGAGQLGSRHLQGLKQVDLPLSINVIDPNHDSLKLAKQRYQESFNSSFEHSIEFFPNIQSLKDKEFDLAIIATNSDVRRKVLEELFSQNTVKSVILEKLLFQRREDFLVINEIFSKFNTKAWVNCSMRSTPFYQKLKEIFNLSVIRYAVSGSRFGLVTNLIHYIDHMIFLTGCSDFIADSTHLDTKLIASKRKGFLEINGNFYVNFKNGSTGVFTCYPEGDLPVLVEVISKDVRCISREWEKKAWISKKTDNWVWEELDADIPYQSQLTIKLAEEILSKGTCPLVSYPESMKTHLLLLESLAGHLNLNSSQKYDYYPFT